MQVAMLESTVMERLTHLQKAQPTIPSQPLVFRLKQHPIGNTAFGSVNISQEGSSSASEEQNGGVVSNGKIRSKAMTTFKVNLSNLKKGTYHINNVNTN